MAAATQLLYKFHPFSELAPEYLERIAEASEVMGVAKGKIVFQRGKDLPHLYYLVEGSVNLVDSSFESALLASTETTSQYALNELNPSKASAVAATEVTVLMVERHQLDLVMAASEVGPDLPIEALGNLAGGDLVTEQINYLDAYADSNPDKPSGEQQDWMSKLLDSPLFDLIPAGNIQKLFTRFQPLDFAAGDPVIEEGQEGDYFYVLANGQAQVMTTSGKVVSLTVGDYFGEEALVGDTTRNATVMMTSHGTVMRLSKGDFIELLQEPLFRYVELEQLDAMGPQLSILDVRLPVEHRHTSVTGSRNITLRKLRDHLNELDPGITYVVTDDAGSRSKVAVQLMLQAGLSAMILNDSGRGYA